MGDNSTDGTDGYLRAAIVTSEHPGKPLDGVVVAIATSHDVSVNEPFLGALVQQAEERFDIDQYAAELRLGTAYFDAASHAIVGVTWEESPLVYEHGDFDEPVDVLPDDLLAADDLLE
jgi:hypothetical protein